MRKLVPLVVIAVIMAMATPAGAKKVVNESYSQVEIGAWWGVDEGTWLNAWAFDGSMGTGLSFQYSESLECPDEPTPDDLANIWFDAGGEWDTFDVVTKGKDKYTSGYADGMVYGSAQVWYCDGGFEEGEFATWLVIDMNSDGPLIKASNTDSFHIPGDVNQHGRATSTYRDAYGAVTVEAFGAEVFDVEGIIGQAKWSGHQNCKKTCPEGDG